MDVATGNDAIQSRIERFLDAQDNPESQEDEQEPQQSAQAEETEVEEPVIEDDDGEQEPETDAEEDEGEKLSLSDLADYLGLDPEKLDSDESGSLYIKTKIDGEEGRATLADLIKSYQLEGHLNKQNMEVAERSKALGAKMEELDRQTQERLQHLDDLGNIAWNELVREYQSVDWQSLRTSDPAEFAARQADFQNRQAAIQGLHQQMQQQRQQLSQQQQIKQQQHLAEQHALLGKLIPEWKDESVAEQERADIRKYAMGLGLSQQDIEGVTDARHVLLLRKAMLYDKLQQSKASVTKAVKKAPKVARPGKATDKSEREQASVRKIKETIQKSGGKSGVADYLLRTGKV